MAEDTVKVPAPPEGFLLDGETIPDPPEGFAVDSTPEPPKGFMLDSPQEQGFLSHGGESLQRGLFRVLPKQVGQAADFLTDLGLALDPFAPIQKAFFPEAHKQSEESLQELKEKGFSGKAFEQLGELVDVPEAKGKYAEPIKDISELKDPKRAIQVIGEQGPAMIANIAAYIAQPQLGVAFMFGLEGGEAYETLKKNPNISQTERLVLSSLVGSVNAALEKLGFDVILKSVPPGIKSRLAHLALSPITEATTESLQEINQIIADKTGKRDFEITVEDLQRIGNAAYGGAVLGIVGGGSSQAIQYGVEAVEKQTEETQEVESVSEASEGRVQGVEQERQTVEPGVEVETSGGEAVETGGTLQETEVTPTPQAEETEVVKETKPKKQVPGERTFPKSLEEQGLEGGTDRLYEVYGDKKAVNKATKRIEENEEGALRFAKEETGKLSKDQVTTGILLLQKMKNEYEAAETEIEKENLAEKQVELANSLSRRLTEAGQAVQAASIVARLSPEGLLLYTQKKINQINKTRPEAKQLSITQQDVEKINTISKNVQEAVEVDENVKDVVDIVNKIGKGEKLSSEELKRMVDLNNQLQKEYGEKPSETPETKKKSIKQSAVDRLNKAEEAAKQRLKERGYNLNVGIDPGTLADFAVIGATKIGKVGVKFLEWSGEMVAEFGEEIRPHLKKIFKKSVDLWKSENRRARESQKLQSELNGILRKMESNTDVTEVELNTVRDLLERIETYSGETREEALYELQDFMRSFEPISLGRKLATAQTVAQLLNPKTNIRNILGNEIFFRLERLNKYTTSPIDWAASLLTGKERTVTFRKAGQGGFWEGLIKGAKAGWQGHNIQNLETQFNLKGQTFSSKFNPLTWMEKAMGATLRGFDYAAYNRAYNQFLGEQAELHIINNKLKFADKEARKRFVDDYMKKADTNIQQMAHETGKYLTFQDENRISNVFVSLKKILNLGKDFGIGDFVLKYPKTPANLLARALEYSPAGLARSISILHRPYTDPNFKRRDALQALSRAITGTMGLTGLGAILYSMGALSGGEEKDRDVREFKAQQTGERNYQVNMSAIKRFMLGGFKPELLKKREGDSLVSYDWAQPIAISIAAGANMAKAISENSFDLKAVGDIAYQSIDAALNTLVEQPLVRGVQEAFGNAYGGSVVKRLSKILVGVPASFTPTFFSQLAQYTDNDRRITYDPNPLQQSLNKVIYKLPFVKGTLEKTYKTIGDEIPAENYKDGSNTLFNVFLNPSFISKYGLDPEIQKILMPFEQEERKKQFPKVAPYTIRAGQKTLRKYGLRTENAIEVFRLGPEDISEFQRLMAKDITKKFQRGLRNIGNRSYEWQERYLAKKVNESYEDTKKWFFRNKAANYLKQE